jgi:hypothetical protein
MAEGTKSGLPQMVPSLFNGIATAIAAAAGLIGLLHQVGFARGANSSQASTSTSTGDPCTQ